MHRPIIGGTALVIALAGWAYPLTAQVELTPAQGPSAGRFLLSPPPGPGPVEVRTRFHVENLLEINDGNQTFTFTGVLSLSWIDPREAFDPAVAGVEEKVYQGAYQFNEVATGWYPQLVLVNPGGPSEMTGVLFRIQPDGRSTLITAITTTAKVELKMTWYPFDQHHLGAIFEVLGFDRDQILLVADTVAAGSNVPTHLRVPQWSITGAAVEVLDRPARYDGAMGTASALIARVEVARDPLYIVRLVILPLVLIVLLSFSVFWMDRSSLGERISVSFIGILTGVTYQMLIAENLPHISYITLVHGFLTLSFVTMCATVVINIMVAGLDKTGQSDAGDRLDHRCRWIFPVGYVAVNALMVGLTFLLT